MTAVGPGEAPKEWGCDAVWEGGDPVLEKCIAVFGIVYVTKEDAVSPSFFQNIFNTFPEVAGALYTINSSAHSVAQHRLQLCLCSNT